MRSQGRHWLAEGPQAASNGCIDLTGQPTVDGVGQLASKPVKWGSRCVSGANEPANVRQHTVEQKPTRGTTMSTTPHPEGMPPPHPAMPAHVAAAIPYYPPPASPPRLLGAAVLCALRAGLPRLAVHEFHARKPRRQLVPGRRPRAGEIRLARTLTARTKSPSFPSRASSWKARTASSSGRSTRR